MKRLTNKSTSRENQFNMKEFETEVLSFKVGGSIIEIVGASPSNIYVNTCIDLAEALNFYPFATFFYLYKAHPNGISNVQNLSWK